MSNYYLVIVSPQGVYKIPTQPIQMMQQPMQPIQLPIQQPQVPTIYPNVVSVLENSKCKVDKVEFHPKQIRVFIDITGNFTQNPMMSCIIEESSRPILQPFDSVWEIKKPEHQFK